MYKRQLSIILLMTVVAISQAIAADSADSQPAVRKTTKPLKIYILAGQSNMQGKGSVSTVPRMALSPETKELHDKILDEKGTPRVHKNVSIVYFTAGDVKNGEERPLIENKGLLSTGFGNAIGPELGFGITMGQANDEPILIIKTAWGGKSLNKNFRPPSAGVFTPEDPKGGKTKKSSEEALQKQKDDEASQGAYYRLMMKLIKTVLADPGKYCEAYDPKQGYEIAGFGWFQGYNDQFYYPGSYDYYGEVLAHFIRDVRKDLQAPNMPFVIGVIGIGGNNVTNPKMLELRKCMAAPASMPEFKGNVAAVETAGFWDNEMAAALERISKADALFSASGDWIVVGTPEPKDRVWHYTSFTLDKEKQYRNLEEGQEGDERTLTGETPAGLKDWLNPGFDTSKWQKGPAPVGKGVWDQEPKNQKEEQKQKQQKAMIRSPWGEGNMLLMKTTFTLERTDIANLRLCIQSTGSFHVYLNGHLVTDYPWWKDESIRRFDIDAKYVKQGANELAFYGNILNRKGATFNVVDLYLEGLPRAAADEITKRQNALVTPRDRALAKGKSNQEYHYLGSAYTCGQIGEAMAKAMIAMEKPGKQE
jgi:hypothetical protein